LKTILQLQEHQFRDGNYTDELMGFLRECENLIENNIMSIRTNLRFDLQNPIVQAFNHKLNLLRREGVIMIQVLLD
jgi:hypothetical protein